MRIGFRDGIGGLHLDGWTGIIAVVDVCAREAMLFAAIGFLIGGIDDATIDLVYARHRGRRGAVPSVADLRSPDEPGRIAVFVAAWDEAAVIGAMLSNALARFDHPDYRIYVGTYPNDRATIWAVAAVAARDPRVRLIVGREDGPTTKADCLNTIWRAMLRDEMCDGMPVKAIVLHDAEDVVHPAELRIFDVMTERHAVVQLPVHPLIDPRARFVSGHYADEFAEAHSKTLVVRQALGASLPLAGVGCAIERICLGHIAERRHGAPFDAGSLTEDYELGLLIAGLDAGKRRGGGVFARIAEYPGGPIVAVRAYFPARIDAAVRQKTRWMIGIALAGWDRVGWGRARDWREHWMRMRDRRAPVAVLVLIAAYLAALFWATSAILHAISGIPPVALSPAMTVLLTINSGLLVWRLAVRAAFTGRAYGWRQALWSLPRAVVGNFIALAAAQRAVFQYIAMLRGAALRWDKTAHAFPDDLHER
ncbi:glycosyl transferase family protein [Sphingomonas aliaeris]|uniref:glycosyl transferase family protein n=1 Tax=Sphingomonas aliaeris TaxID=2759526 RepID=UPI001CEDF594|nr:glycosyl transferase family protein [Sphingomonas aliaeris]